MEMSTPSDDAPVPVVGSAVVGTTVHLPTPNKEENQAFIPPAFCNGYDCPPFKVDHQYEGFDVRTYEKSGHWISTKMEISPKLLVNEASKITFRRLFNYIRGSNASSQSFKMTVPVVTILNQPDLYKETKSSSSSDASSEASASGSSSSDSGSAKVEAVSTDVASGYLQMMFYVSDAALKEAGLTEPPTPAEQGVHVLALPHDVKIATKSFSGYAWCYYGSVLPHAKKLLMSLDAAGIEYCPCFRENYMVYAGYDAPWKFWNRHNEVMVWVGTKAEIDATTRQFMGQHEVKKNEAAEKEL
eukprot:GHVT01045860.1.p1 GENE.GHVT01045860.1~~GHVT01045860.1.p1  ORF type:complete len:300 (-),score=38.07 GHVT01045860.1:415-1314(-)